MCRAQFERKLFLVAEEAFLNPKKWNQLSLQIVLLHFVTGKPPFHIVYILLHIVTRDPALIQQRTEIFEPRRLFKFCACKRASSIFFIAFCSAFPKECYTLLVREITL